MNVVIRRITTTHEDIARYRACRLEMLADEPIAFRDTYDAAITRPEFFWTERVKRRAQAHEQILLIAEEEEVFVGSITAIIDENRDCWISGVWVRKQHRGSGVAKRLLEQITEWARNVGAQRLMLHVNSMNVRARRFYARQGFQLTGEKHRNENFPGTDELEMSRTLAA